MMYRYPYSKYDEEKKKRLPYKRKINKRGSRDYDSLQEKRNRVRGRNFKRPKKNDLAEAIKYRKWDEVKEIVKDPVYAQGVHIAYNRENGVYITKINGRTVIFKAGSQVGKGHHLDNIEDLAGKIFRTKHKNDRLDAQAAELDLIIKKHPDAIVIAHSRGYAVATRTKHSNFILGLDGAGVLAEKKDNTVNIVNFQPVQEQTDHLIKVAALSETKRAGYKAFEEWVPPPVKWVEELLSGAKFAYDEARTNFDRLIDAGDPNDTIVHYMNNTENAHNVLDDIQYDQQHPKRQKTWRDVAYDLVRETVKGATNIDSTAPSGDRRLNTVYNTHEHLVEHLTV